MRPRLFSVVAIGTFLLLAAFSAAQLLLTRGIVREARSVARERILSTLLSGAAAAARSRGPRAWVEDYGGDAVVFSADEAGAIHSRSTHPLLPESIPRELRERARAEPGAVVHMRPPGARGVVAISAVDDGFVGVIDSRTGELMRATAREALWRFALGAAAIALVVAFAIAAWTNRRSHRVVERMRLMAEGRRDVRLGRGRIREFDQAVAAFNALADELAGTIDRLEAERDARRRTFADWTHEISTPLTSVSGYLECLQDPGVRGDQATTERYLETAHQQAEVLLALVDDLAALARLEFDGLDIERSRTDLARIVRAEREAAAAAAERKGVTLQQEGADELHALADGQRMAQVIRNLLHNAIRHTPSGGVVAMRVVGADAAATIEVRDTGEGIPARHLPHLGERFYRVDEARSRSTGGRGLGLAIARGIVAAHGGSMTIESEVGVGTTVRVQLPLPPR